VSARLLVVLRPLGLGDFLTGVPAYRALARTFPRHRRVLAAPRALHALVAATGAFDAACDVAPLEALPRRLHDADIAVDLHGRGPASHRVLLAARPRHLLAFANEAIAQSASGPCWIAEEHEVARWCRLVSAYGATASPGDLRLARPAASRSPLRGITIVHPGAASAARRWPLERWVRVVRALQRDGHTVALTGSGDEAALAADLAARTGIVPTHDLSRRTSLEALSALVAHAKLVLSSDTGIAHLAVAHATPSITLFGPSSPAHWGPPAHPRHRVLWAGRTGDPHGTAVDPGLLAITAEDVVAAIAEPALLAG